MNHKRQNQIEQLAKNLLIETGCYTYPRIDVEKVASVKGLEVVHFGFGEDISGVLMTENGVSIIGVHNDHPPTRKRFTIAHELGHYFLGHQRNGGFVDTVERYYTMISFRNPASSTGEHLQEREANAFAAALLMPKDMLYQAMDSLERTLNLRATNINIAYDLAKKFEVSEQAMTFRLTNLNTLW
jgi:Zn-dependent peptidase ImmA (M78 family)